MSAKWKVTVFGGIVAAISLILLSPLAQAGTFTTGTFTGDSDSPVNAYGLFTNYTHAVDIFGANATTSINGITFSSSGTTIPPSGSNYSTTGFTSGWTAGSPGYTPSVDATAGNNGMYTVLSDFIYGKDGTTGKSTVTLTGLSANKTYITNFYVSGFPGCYIDINTSKGDSLTGWNRGTSSGGAYLQYQFTTGASENALTFSFTPQSPNDTFHFYGFSNEVVTETGLYNTGNNSSRKTLASGAVDSHWTVSKDGGAATAAYAVTSATAGFPTGAWMGDDTASTWINSSGTSVNADPGNYTYTTTFDLTGVDSSSWKLTGKFLTDDSFNGLYLNGVKIDSVTGGGFASWASFSLTSGFQTGMNTLSFVVNNGGAAANPTGLRVEFTGGSLVPEPSMIALLSTGLFGLICYAWRKRRG